MTTRRTAITTGANSGIGLATVIELARRGFRSVGTVRSEAKAAVVADAAHAAGVDVETVLLDVTDADLCARASPSTSPARLVNNAGYSITGSIEDVTDAEARAAFETMVLAPMRLARLALPHMRAAAAAASSTSRRSTVAPRRHSPAGTRARNKRWKASPTRSAWRLRARRRPRHPRRARRLQDRHLGGDRTRDRQARRIRATTRRTGARSPRPGCGNRSWAIRCSAPRRSGPRSRALAPRPLSRRLRRAGVRLVELADADRGEGPHRPHRHVALRDDRP